MPCRWRSRKAGVAGNDPKEWKRTVLALPDTFQLFIEGTYVFSCVREAAKFTRRGRATLQSSVVATLQIVDSTIPVADRFLPFGLDNPPLADPTQPVYLDVRGVRNPVTKARNVRYWVACSPGWIMSFAMEWDKTVVSRNEMEAVLQDAGKLVGLGNGRSIGYGRFEVSSINRPATVLSALTWLGAAGRGAEWLGKALCGESRRGLA